MVFEVLGDVLALVLLLVNELLEATTRGSIGEMYAGVKYMSVKRAAARKSPKVKRVLNDEGVPCVSVVEEQGVFRDHFAEQLAGYPTSFSSPLSKSLNLA